MSSGDQWPFDDRAQPGRVIPVPDLGTCVAIEPDAPPVTDSALSTRQAAPRFIDRLTSDERKQFPICTGFLDYFPDATAAVSHIAWLGNQKHNAGQPLHHARGKSTDHSDCLLRHMSTRHSLDPAYESDILAPVFHRAEAAWRAMADLQEAMERVYFLGMAPAARP